MEYLKALSIAEDVKAQLSPYCKRIEIAGSIRRKSPEVKDIEIVAIPKPYEVGLFASEIVTIIDGWKRIKGDLPCKYTQRVLPEGINLDLFFADEINWGLIYAIRTGSAEYAHKILATGWVNRGYKSIDGYLTNNGRKVYISEEEHLFKRIGIPMPPPELRKI